MTCPKCDGDIDAFIVKQWGTTPEEAKEDRFHPYICSWCASLMLIDLGLNKLITREEALNNAGVDIVEAMQRNKALWKAVTEHQALILSTPQRRKVLR